MKLPDFSPLRVTQDSGKPGKKRFDALDHVAVIVPKNAGSNVISTLPQGKHLKTLFKRARVDKDRFTTTHLANARATAVTLARFSPADAFGTLSWARRLIAECLRHSPRKLGVLAVGLADPDREAVLLALVAAAAAAAFRLPTFKSKNGSKDGLRAIQILAAKPRLKLDTVLAEATGNNIARWFTALPPNLLTSKSYRHAVETIAKEHGLTFEFYGERRLRELGAGAFLAVAQGNADRDAGILHLKYRPARQKEPDLALVGKGILFDTGGNNLKPFKGMLDMHTDMQGSAVALGATVALAALEARFAIDTWLAVTENRISAEAYKSQDVIHAANGTSIQVIHTDAEGRMVLADTLALAASAKPKLIIDFATLTGSCVAALTSRYCGVFSNRSGANSLLLANGIESGERVWPFPMDEDFEDSLRSEVADIKQCAADGNGDHILAARFLMRFVPDAIPWVHLDLSAGQHKGGLAHVPTEITGFGVRYTVRLLREMAPMPEQLVARFVPA